MNKTCEIFDNYEMQEWLDEIVDVDDYGNVIHERDEDGNVIHLTDHFGRPLENPFTGEPIPKVKLLQEGTRVTARRMNHIEKHICSLYGWKELHANALEYIMIILELEGSISGGQGTFFDAISDLTPTGIFADEYRTELKKGVESGATELVVADANGLSIGDEVSIFDDKNFETVAVTGFASDGIKVSAVENSYHKGANVARSTAVTDRPNKKYTTRAFTVFNVTSDVI